MYDVSRTMIPVMKKLDEQVDKGITTGNIEWLCKLSEIGKNMKKIEYYDSVIEEMQNGHSYGDGYSERRHRDSRGRYSRNDGYERGSSYNYSRDGGYSEARGDYMEAKHSYRSTRSPDSKRDMIASLDECKHRFREELQEMLSGADTREERDKIKEMIREIGNLA